MGRAVSKGNHPILWSQMSLCLQYWSLTSEILLTVLVLEGSSCCRTIGMSSIYSHLQYRVKGEGGQRLGDRQGLCLLLGQHITRVSPWEGSHSWVIKNSSASQSPNYSWKTATKTPHCLKSAPESEHSHSPAAPKGSWSNLMFPHTSSLCTNIAKSHKLLSWQSTQEWSMAMSNVFLKAGQNLWIALKMSLKMNSKEGVALRMHLGIIYWRNDTLLEKLTQSNMYIRNQLQWGGEATSCLGFTQNHLSEESGHFLHLLHIRAKTFSD